LIAYELLVQEVGGEEEMGGEVHEMEVKGGGARGENSGERDGGDNGTHWNVLRDRLAEIDTEGASWIVHVFTLAGGADDEVGMPRDAITAQPGAEEIDRRVKM
jgi:hypothetical protein